LFLMRNYEDPELINIGWGRDISILELAELVAGIVGYTGRIEWNTTKPDGTARKLLDTSRLTALGWKPAIGLRDGIGSTYRWCREQEARWPEPR
jgi:GDP-L-fucose synthase